MYRVRDINTCHSFTSATVQYSPRYVPCIYSPRQFGMYSTVEMYYYGIHGWVRTGLQQARIDVLHSTMHCTRLGLARQRRSIPSQRLNMCPWSRSRNIIPFGRELSLDRLDYSVGPLDLLFLTSTRLRVAILPVCLGTQHLPTR